MRFAYGDAVAPLKVVGPAPEGKKGTKVTFLASPADVQDHRIRLREARASLSRAGVPQFGRPPVPARRAARGGRGDRALLRGRDRRVREVS